MYVLGPPENRRPFLFGKQLKVTVEICRDMWYTEPKYARR